MAEPITVAGPSHCIAWAEAITNGKTVPPSRDIHWHTWWGMSSVTPFFRNADCTNHPVDTLFFVSNFRLDNRLLVMNIGEPGWQGGVDPSLVSPENDAAMYTMVMEHLRSYRDKNPRIRFIFWSLGAVELANREEGRYVTNGTYNHPSWNLADVEAVFPENTVPLAEVLQHPLAHRLFIDRPGHPSHIGYTFLNALVDNPGASPAHIFADIVESTPTRLLDFPQPTLLTGTSNVIGTLRGYRRRGLLDISPRLILSDHAVIDRHGPDPKLSRAFYLSSAGTKGNPSADDLTQIHREIDEIRSRGVMVDLYLWDREAVRIAPRPERPNDGIYLYENTEVAKADDTALQATLDNLEPQPLDLALRDIERTSDVPRPTIHGVCSLIETLGGSVR
jgi:hypothetical protein